jgi:UPF0042 nucleotide-binding protein
MHTRFVSFGFRFGAPVDADLVLDVRFLNNPYFVDQLRALPGTAEPVSSYVLSSDEAREFLTRALDLLKFVLPRFEREGKSYATIGIGCTGGRHRSVVIAEELARAIGAESNIPVDVIHRDVERDESDAVPAPRVQRVDGGAR